MYGMLRGWVSTLHLADVPTSCMTSPLAPLVLVTSCTAVHAHQQHRWQDLLNLTAQASILMRTVCWFAVQLKAVDFHKLRNVLEEFGQRSVIAQVSSGTEESMHRCALTCAIA